MQPRANSKYRLYEGGRKEKFGILLVKDYPERPLKSTRRLKWWVKPIYDYIGAGFSDETRDYWSVGIDTKYGLMDMDTRQLVLPMIYRYPLYFNDAGTAITWRDYKAGVINLQGEEIVPFIYDDVWYLTELVPAVHIDRNGEERPYQRHKRIGYIGYNIDGTRQGYDLEGHPRELTEEEAENISWKPDLYYPEYSHLTIEELEDIIRKEYTAWREMGGGETFSHVWRRKPNQAIDEQEHKIHQLLVDRRRRMNEVWVDNKKNADRIKRVNDLLMRAVRKVIQLGNRTAKDLKWMEKVPCTYYHDIRIFIYPQWTNSTSDWDYTPDPSLSKAKQREKLSDEEADCHNHIWNIIAAMGSGMKEDGVALCFYHDMEGRDAPLTVKEATLDDGQTWAEGIDLPVYQDVYMTYPFHLLFHDNYEYSLEDLARINDFRVRVEVGLETKEQDRRRR